MEQMRGESEERKERGKEGRKKGEGENEKRKGRGGGKKKKEKEPLERFELSTPGLQDQCSNH